MREIISHSPSETSTIAEQWVGNIDARDEAVVVALNGHLGSGKTTFVQSVARALGVKDNITSPTFVIMKKYELGGAGQPGDARFKHLVHIDAYRLERGADLDALEFENIVSDPGNLVLIEWADNVKDGLPEDIQKIDFEYVSESERKIDFK